MSVITRIAEPTDATVLHDLAAATFALACPPETTQASILDFISTHLSRERFVGYLADSARELILAEHNGVAVGYTMLVYSETSDPDVAASLTKRPSAELSKLYVLPSHHGSGLSATLMAASVDAVSARGYGAMWLGVNQQNARANRFYEKQGFTIVGAKKFLVGERWEDDFVRERILDQSGSH